MVEKNIDKLNEIILCLNDKNYDFGNANDCLSLKFNELEREKKKQDKIIEIVKEMTRDKFIDYFRKIGKMQDFSDNYDDYFSSIFRIENHQNYYFVWFCGESFMDINFVFDKCGNLLFNEGSVHGLDAENFLIIKYESREMLDRMYHYQLRDGKFDLVKCLDNVNDIDYNDFFKSDRLVICSCNGDNLLYNYKAVRVMIPSYSDIDSDLGELRKFYYGDVKNSVRVVKKIFIVEDYRFVMVSKLEYLVDEYGYVNADVPVWDLENKNYYYVFTRDDQEKQLNSIYDKVRIDCVANREKANKRIKKK